MLKWLNAQLFDINLIKWVISQPHIVDESGTLAPSSDHNDKITHMKKTSLFTWPNSEFDTIVNISRPVIISLRCNVSLWF